MRSWSPSYFVRWCALWVVYVGLRALLLSPSLEAFCDLLTCSVRSQTRALIAWAGISSLPSGWTAIFLKPCSLCVFFHAFYVLDWTIDRITELLPDLFFSFKVVLSFCVLQQFLPVSCLHTCLICPKILPVSLAPYWFLCFVFSPMVELFVTVITP